MQQQPCQLMCLQHLSDLIFGSPPAQEELICRVPGALHCQKGLNSGTLHGLFWYGVLCSDTVLPIVQYLPPGALPTGGQK